MKKNSRKPRKPLNLRAICWRIWIVGSLGWLLITGMSAGSTVIICNDLTTEQLRLEATIKKTVAGSYERWQANFKLRQVSRNLGGARKQLLRDAAHMFLPPLAILVIGLILGLIFGGEEDQQEPASA